VARNWGKKYEEVSKRISKKGKLAEEGHHLKQQADKKLATESLEEKMIRTGVVNFETNEVVDYKVANADDDVWGFMNKSFFNKLVEDTKQNTQEKVEAEMMEQFEAMLNKVLDARESTKRADEIRLAELRVRELELQVELAKLQSNETMVPVTHGKLEEVIEEHSAAVDTILNTVVVTEKPAKKKRVGTKKNKVEEVVSLQDGWSVPIRKGRSGYSVAWKQVIEQDRLVSTVSGVVKWAKEQGANIHDTNAFRKFHPVCQGAYIQVTKAHPGKGSWESLLNELGL
jgi:hypothetical protein